MTRATPHDMPKKLIRGALSKGSSKIVSVWLPDEIVALLDQEVRNHDTDRSKEIRKALRIHLQSQHKEAANV